MCGIASSFINEYIQYQCHLLTHLTAGHLWLTSIFLATQGRDQEDEGSKPAGRNSSGDPILKILNTQKGW
jgi:hypothetical protein